MTQAELAKKLGVNTTTVARYETKLPPRGPSLLALANIASQSSPEPLLAKCFTVAYELFSKKHDVNYVDRVLRGDINEEQVTVNGICFDELLGGISLNPRYHSPFYTPHPSDITADELFYIRLLIDIFRSEESERKSREVEIIKLLLLRLSEKT